VKHFLSLSVICAVAFGTSLATPWVEPVNAVDNDGCASPDAAPSEVADVYQIDSQADVMWVKGGIDGSTTAQWGSSYEYKQTADIDMTGCTWETAIGSSSTNFEGIYDGGGYAITNLTVSKASVDYLGLFGDIGANSTVKNLSITNATVSGGSYIGILAGSVSSGATIENISTSGSATGSGERVGGLIGESQADVSNSSSSATVVADGQFSRAGGLIGYATGSIGASSASGSVTGQVYVGGLVGYNTGPISTSSATGTVSGALVAVGGLTGQSSSSITDSYASGDVSASSGSDAVGGLVGNMNASGESIQRSFSSGAVQVGSGLGSDYIGGLVGDLQIGTVSASYALGTVTAASSSRVGGLIGQAKSGTSVNDSFSTGTISGGSDVGGLIGNAGSMTLEDSYSTGAVSGAGAQVGGLLGRESGATASDSYWDTQTSGQATSATPSGGGVTGVTTANMKTLSTFSDATWDIGDGWQSGETWGICDGTTYPFLIWQYDTSPCSLATPTVDTAESTSSGFTFNVTNYDSDYTYSFSATSGSASAGTATGSDLPVTVTGVAGGSSSTVTVTASRTGYTSSSASLTGRATGGNSGGSGGAPSTPGPTAEPTTRPTIPTIQVNPDSLLLDPDGGPLVVPPGGTAAYSDNGELPTPELIQDGSLWTASGSGYALQVLGPQPSGMQERSTTTVMIPAVTDGQTVAVAARGFAPGGTVRGWVISSASPPTEEPSVAWEVDATGSATGVLLVDVQVPGSHTLQVRGPTSSGSVLSVLFGLTVEPRSSTSRFAIKFRADRDVLTKRSLGTLDAVLGEGKGSSSNVTVTLRRLRADGSAGRELARERKRELRKELISLGVPRPNIDISIKGVKKLRFAKRSIVDVRLS